MGPVDDAGGARQARRSHSSNRLRSSKSRSSSRSREQGPASGALRPAPGSAYGPLRPQGRARAAAPTILVQAPHISRAARCSAAPDGVLPGRDARKAALLHRSRTSRPVVEAPLPWDEAGSTPTPSKAVSTVCAVVSTPEDMTIAPGSVPMPRVAGASARLLGGQIAANAGFFVAVLLLARALGPAGRG